METAPIKFQQERDFGEIFNATFEFIKQEFKPLGKAILYYVIPILIVAGFLGVVIGVQQQRFTSSLRGTGSPQALLGVYKYVFLILLVYVAGLTALRCTVYAYIKLYISKGKDQFSTEDIWQEIKKIFFPILGTSFLVAFLVGVGFVLCILPGIYLGVSICLIYLCMVFENMSFSDALSRSFALIKSAWWITFGILLVAFIIYYLLVILISIPAMLMGLKTLVFAFKNPANMADFNFSTTYYIINSITTVVGYLMFTVPIVALTFQYFSLVEIKEKPSLLDKIDQIG